MTTPPTNPPAASPWSLALVIFPGVALLAQYTLQWAIVPKFAEIAMDFEVKLSALSMWVISKPNTFAWFGAGIIGVAIALTFTTKRVALRLIVNLLAGLLIAILILAIGFALLDISTRMASIASSAPTGGGSATSAPAGASGSPGP